MTLPDLDLPMVLVLLPLALLPLLRRRRDESPHPWTELLPDDPVGTWVARLWQLVAVLTIASLVIGLAGPHRSGTEVERITRGAEISLVLDRSSSMDQGTRRNVPEPGKGATEVRSKNEVVRDALTRLLNERPDNRFALTMFNVAPIRIAPFTDNAALVQAGLDASGIGRGPSKTDIGRALLAAIDAFAGRDYTGSRAIVLVSDGGARLDDTVREAVARELARQRVALYFIYVQSGVNSPDLELVGTDVGRDIDNEKEEVALHLFFQGLDIEYRVFQAHDPDSMARAIAEIDRAQNLPLTITERLPRVDHRTGYWAFALLGLLLLAGIASLRRTTGATA